MDVSVPVTRREAQLPYGYVMRELTIVPALAVNVSPRQAIVPLSMTDKSVRVRVELLNNAPSGSRGRLALKLPAGWKAEPAAIPFTLRAAGREVAASVHRVRAGDREPRVHDRRGGDSQRTRVQGGLRHHRAPRSRDALPLSRRDRARRAAST